MSREEWDDGTAQDPGHVPRLGRPRADLRRGVPDLVPRRCRADPGRPARRPLGHHVHRGRRTPGGTASCRARRSPPAPRSSCPDVRWSSCRSTSRADCETADPAARGGAAAATAPGAALGPLPGRCAPRAAAPGGPAAARAGRVRRWRSATSRCRPPTPCCPPGSTGPRSAAETRSRWWSTSTAAGFVLGTLTAADWLCGQVAAAGVRDRGLGRLPAGPGVPGADAIHRQPGPRPGGWSNTPGWSAATRTGSPCSARAPGQTWPP